MDGWTAGVQGGWNWQTRCTVFGIEADYNWANADSDVTFGVIGFPGAALAVSHKLQGFGTVRARTGVVVDNLMMFVTGGLAYAFTERSVAVSLPGFGTETFSSEKSRLGWTLGVGTEWQFAPSWSFKSEVLFARFQREDSTFTCTINCGGSRHDSSMKARLGSPASVSITGSAAAPSAPTDPRDIERKRFGGPGMRRGLFFVCQHDRVQVLIQADGHAHVTKARRST